VTDLSSPAPRSMPLCEHDARLPLPPPSAAPRAPAPGRIRALPPLRCSICGRPGVTVRFWWLYCRLFWRLRWPAPEPP
jgi:hypothetical protein